MANQRIQLRNIQVNEFAIVALKEPIPTGQTFNFDINFGYGVQVENSAVTVLTTISVFGKDKSTVYSRLQTALQFVVNEPEFAKSDDKGNTTIGKELAQELNSIALSTTRGILYGHLKGTYLHAAILPVVNMNQN
ncbi:MAG: hypothetical protein Kapaf2KO_03180 [Candidatus Kapaibacteriales bacterium]